MLACLRETLWGVVAEVAPAHRPAPTPAAPRAAAAPRRAVAQVSGTSALSPEEAVAYADKNYARLASAHAAFFAAA